MSRSPSAASRSASPPPRRRLQSDDPDDAPASKRKRYVPTSHISILQLTMRRSVSPPPRDRSVSPPNRRRRSQSPPSRPSNGPKGSARNGDEPKVVDIDPYRRRAREAALLESQINSNTNGGSAAPAGAEGALVKANGEATAKAEFAKLLGSRSGGAYIPPARLRAMQAEAAKDKTSAEYQRLSWDALRKSINGLINKVSGGETPIAKGPFPPCLRFIQVLRNLH